MYRLGVDTGGTFTDFVLFTPEGIRTCKVPSTPADPAQAILAGLQELGLEHTPMTVVHGTTVGTNAFLERKGAPTLLVTTDGFQDVLFIGRQNRQHLYRLAVERPAPIIGPEAVTGVRERVLPDGTVALPLGTSAGKRLRRLVRQQGYRSVAVCLLHAYANPTHEQQLASALAPLGLPLTLSSSLLPEFREYERTTTTLINAYLAPVVAAYIQRLAERLPAGSRLFVQQSNGGILPAAGIGQRAVHTILSGPAGGVHGAVHLGRLLGRERLITFDMGGTSTDVCLCDHGATLTREHHIDGYPIRNQVMDIHTVGAGGGSIAWIDAGGLLRVGPESAGADPGPACYGRATLVTVTDANLCLGRLPAGLLAGTMTLDRDRAWRCLGDLARRLALSPTETALGIVRIVNAAMVKAVRAVSLERGYDPKDFVLLAFGGASALHCCELAEQLAIPTILVPDRAGILSAQGMVLNAPAMDGSRACFLAGRHLDRHRLAAAIQDLADTILADARRVGLGDELTWEAAVDLRYQGQSHELTVPWSATVEEGFHQAHRQRFGYTLADRPLEAVAVRVTVRGPGPGLALSPGTITGQGSPPAREQRPVVLEDGRRQLLPVYRRSDLAPGHGFLGPALVEDAYTTIFVTPAFAATVDRWHNIVLERTPQ